MSFAVITGACSGIGRAVADGLGRRGHGLVVVSNRPEPLARAAAELRAAHGVEVHPIAMDLARPEAAAELHGAVRALGVEPEVLVLNAGVLLFGEVADAPLDRASALLLLHVVTPSLLATLFGRDLRARRRGHVLFVSSISARRDFPGIAYYGASKKYLRGFAASLRSELSPYGVGVTCLLPGATATSLYDGTGAPVALATRLGVMLSAERVADEGLAALFSGRAEVVPGRLTRAMTAAAELVPQPLVDALRRHNPWLPVRPEGE